MDSFTVAPELRGTKGDIIAARIEVPILVVMIYGIVEFIRLGWSQDYYFYTYAPVLGRSSSRNKGSIRVSTSVATDNRKLLSSRASGPPAAPTSSPSHTSPIT